MLMKTEPAPAQKLAESARSILARCRTDLADQKVPAVILGAVEALQGLQRDLSSGMGALTDSIRQRALDTDETARNALKAERQALGDLLSDAEDLEEAARELYERRLVEERDDQAVEVAKICKQAAIEQRDILIEAGPLLQKLVALAGRYQAAKQTLDKGNQQLRGLSRHDLVEPGALSGMRAGDEPIGAPFQFLADGGLFPRRASTTTILDIVDRLKAGR